MSWTIAQQAQEREILSLLKEEEISCASLSERLRAPSPGVGGKSSRLAIPRPEWARIWLFKQQPGDQQIDALLYLEAGGFAFPLFRPKFFAQDENTRRAALDELWNAVQTLGWNLFSVMGKKRAVNAFLDMCGQEPYHRVEYLVMSRGPEQAGLALSYPNSNGVRWARRGDEHALLHIQLDYEREEVLIPGKQLYPAFSLRQLKESIEKKRVIWLEVAGTAVAKAQTNAVGFSVEQIGGVFTAAEYRSRGFGSLLIEQLARDILSRNNIASLFVKRSNLSAMRVYKKCGFINGPEFSIAYFA